MALKLKMFIPTRCLMVGYYFYTSVYFGYFLSEIFYHFFDTIHKTNISKWFQLRKKFHFKNIIKDIIDFFWKFIQQWLSRIFQKSVLFLAALNKSVIGIKIFLKKILKKPFRFQRNFRLFKILLLVFSETFRVFCSFINEILFVKNIINWLLNCRTWIINWQTIIELAMQESIAINKLVYTFYWILLGLFLGLFGIFLGFLFNFYRRNNNNLNERSIFLLLVLLTLLSQSEFSDVLLEDLPNFSIPHTTPNFSFKSLPEIERHSFKMMLKKTDQIPQIPFPLLVDPAVDVDFMIEIVEEPTKYKFQLFLQLVPFYPNQKIKS